MLAWFHLNVEKFWELVSLPRKEHAGKSWAMKTITKANPELSNGNKFKLTPINRLPHTSYPNSKKPTRKRMDNSPNTRSSLVNSKIQYESLSLEQTTIQQSPMPKLNHVNAQATTYRVKTYLGGTARVSPGAPGWWVRIADVVGQIFEPSPRSTHHSL